MLEKRDLEEGKCDVRQKAINAEVVDVGCLKPGLEFLTGFVMLRYPKFSHCS